MMTISLKPEIEKIHTPTQRWKGLEKIFEEL